MTKRSYLIFFGSFLAGLLIGAAIIHFAAAARVRKNLEMFQIYKAAGYSIAAMDASHAYYNESRPVAIYVLSQELLKLKQEGADAPENPFISDGGVAVGMVITDGRLAKLYAEAGEGDLEAQRVAEALAWSRKTNRPFTNETQLTNFIITSDRLFEHQNAESTNMTPGIMAGLKSSPP